jgi:hypothetical protein
MSTSDSNSTLTHYTAFWPLVIVLATVLIISGFELFNLLEQRQKLRDASAQLEKKVQQAQTVNTTLSKMSRELLQLSSNSVEAKNIVRDFGIQLRQSQDNSIPVKK